MSVLVSVVIPVYNMGSSIKRCVESVEKQDYRELEIILVDDGSTDDSLERCKNIAAKDARIAVYHTENRGSGPARNYGIERSKGEYIYFPDADDYLEPTAIGCLVRATESGKYDTVVFGFRSLNPDGKEVLKKSFSEYSVTGEHARCDYADYMGHTTKYGIQGAPWNKLFSASVVKNNKVEYPPLRRHQDEGFIARYMSHARNVHFIEDVLYIHYVNDLKKEWDKFPVNYIDSVIGLYANRKETILSWNPEDKKTHDMVYKEYICNIIKACELTFSPKMKLNFRERKAKLEEYIRISNLLSIPAPDILGKYQRILLKQIRKGSYTSVLGIMKIKISFERIGLLEKIR